MRAEYWGMISRRSEGERDLGWSIWKCGERRARPSGETFSGMRIRGRGVVESWSGVERAEGAIVSLSFAYWTFILVCLKCFGQLKLLGISESSL